MRLKSFSNLDHHFIRHDGFVLPGKVELGKGDTSEGNNASHNSFIFQKEEDKVRISSSYSEEPFFLFNGKERKLLSAHYAVPGSILRFRVSLAEVTIKQHADGEMELIIQNEKFKWKVPPGKNIVSILAAFREDPAFASSRFVSEIQLTGCLKNIFIIPMDDSIVYYLSGRLFQFASSIKINDRIITKEENSFSIDLPFDSRVGWGLRFNYGNVHQYRLKDLGKQGVGLMNIFPVAYPLIEEKRDQWSTHTVHKFLVSGSSEMTRLPSLFNEGYKYQAEDSHLGFRPAWLSYVKTGGGKHLDMKVRDLDDSREILSTNGEFFIPSRNGDVNWVFSIQNTLVWNFSSFEIPASQWKLILFSSLVIYFLLVFLTAIIQPGHRLNWAWQLVSCIAMVLLTTRFFLYWRYKSFPPFEGMDLPSYQQLHSHWNFLIIVAVTILMAFILSFSIWKRLFIWVFPRSKNKFKLPKWIPNSETSIFKTAGTAKLWFLGCWFILLGLSMAIAALNASDAALNRHLTLGLIISYFLAVFISYRHSPLVVPAVNAWWTVSTGKWSEVLFANPMKAILSLSMLASFAFIDIGFAIVFLNFILFNEAFLNINYAIAGYSGGKERNLRNFGFAGGMYLALFIANLLYAPGIFDYFLSLPSFLYIAGYVLLSFLLVYCFSRLILGVTARKKTWLMITSSMILFALAYFLVPKERILEKAEMTKYRVAVMTKPVEKVIQEAYESGDGHEPVIRAAQNQWFINTFIYQKNNPGVNSTGFHLLSHAPQHKGARYNAQATDLVASRFLIAEHGNWSVIFYVFLLLLPSLLLASFYQIYPDFTNRINPVYPRITIGFSMLNYLLITALLVILAATGRYIFFGQDLPFGSILSKQSILFPALLLILAIAVFTRVPLEQYPNRKKFIPGFIVFSLFIGVLFFAKPVYNKDKDFRVAGLSDQLASTVQTSLQPLLDHIDTSAATKNLSMARKDRLFVDMLKNLLETGRLKDQGKFFLKEIGRYVNSSFINHIDQRRMIYLDISTGCPRLEVNENYFRVQPPPHLQQYWAGNVYGDSSVYNLSVWQPSVSRMESSRLTEHEITTTVLSEMTFRLHGSPGRQQLWMTNSGKPIEMKKDEQQIMINTGDSLLLSNPARYRIKKENKTEMILVIEPDAFMKNYFVNGSRYYVYPLAEKFIWARNFAESIAAEYVQAENKGKHAFVSLDRELTDSLSRLLATFIGNDTAYYRGAEYGITIADGEGRLISIPDYLKKINRPDPNDKTAFNELLYGVKENNASYSVRKLIGNVNLLRMNPGPGSTMKPIVFASIASQLNLDWEAFASEGFSMPQRYFGGEKVAEYDFEKYNGRISSVSDYLKLSDNYYHSNLLLLGSYNRQELQPLLSVKFANQIQSEGLHWPNFSYKGKDYWLNGFENWPGYKSGRADFGSDSSFVAIGLRNNFSIATRPTLNKYEKFNFSYDSLLFGNAHRRSGYLLPEYALFDQQGRNVDHRIPYDLFAFCFRGHVKGSSQVLVPPVKMVDAYGKLITQNRKFSLTMDPYPESQPFAAFETDPSVKYHQYLSLMREQVFHGMKEALFSGTAARLGNLLKNGSPYYYYAKTGTTGDNEKKIKSKLLTLLISEKDITNPDFNFRNNRFYIIYFTSQHGPAKQNEEFQAAVIRLVERSRVFKKYMTGKKSNPALLADRK